MNCAVCGEGGCFIGHHVSYDPEISIPICCPCHNRIHHGDLYMLDPLQTRCWFPPFTIKDIMETVPSHLKGYAEIAMRQQRYPEKYVYIPTLPDKNETEEVELQPYKTLIFDHVRQRKIES